MVDQQPLSTPTAKVYNGGGQRSEEVELHADQQHSSVWRGWGGGCEAGGRGHSSRLTGGRTQWLGGTMLCLGGALWHASHSTWCPRTKSGLSSWGWGRSPCRCSTPSGGSGRRWCVRPVSCGAEGDRQHGGCSVVVVKVVKKQLRLNFSKVKPRLCNREGKLPPKNEHNCWNFHWGCYFHTQSRQICWNAAFSLQRVHFWGEVLKGGARSYVTASTGKTGNYANVRGEAVYMFRLCLFSANEPTSLHQIPQVIQQKASECEMQSGVKLMPWLPTELSSMCMSRAQYQRPSAGVYSHGRVKMLPALG